MGEMPGNGQVRNAFKTLFYQVRGGIKSTFVIVHHHFVRLQFIAYPVEHHHGYPSSQSFL